MSEAPKTIWAKWDEDWGVFNVNSHGDPRYTDDEAEEYTLTSSVSARLKAADELAEMCIEAQSALAASGFDESLSTDLLRTMTSYRKAKETT